MSDEKAKSARVTRIEPGHVARTWRVILDDGRELDGWRAINVGCDVNGCTTATIEFVTVKGEPQPVDVEDARNL